MSSRILSCLLGGVVLVGLLFIAQGVTPLESSPPATSLTAFDDLYLAPGAADNLLLTAVRKTTYQKHEAYQLTLKGEVDVTAWAIKGTPDKLVPLIKKDPTYDPTSALCFTSNGYTICIPTTAKMPLKWVVKHKRTGLTFVDPDKY
jgi:hypothetical protein